MVMTVERSEFAGRRVAIAGMARTGLAAAPVLRDLGAHVMLSDSQGADALGARLLEAGMLGVDVLPGASPEVAVDGADLLIPSPGIRPDSPLLRLARER